MVAGGILLVLAVEPGRLFVVRNRGRRFRPARREPGPSRGALRHSLAPAPARAGLVPTPLWASLRQFHVGQQQSRAQWLGVRASSLLEGFAAAGRVVLSPAIQRGLILCFIAPTIEIGGDFAQSLFALVAEAAGRFVCRPPICRAAICGGFSLPDRRHVRRPRRRSTLSPALRDRLLDRSASRRSIGRD